MVDIVKHLNNIECSLSKCPMINVKQSLASLGTKILNIAASISLGNGCVGDGDNICKAQITAVSSSSGNYAQVLTTNFSDMNAVVKTVVNQTIKEQQKVNNDRSNFVVYGFPEKNKDRQKLISMLKFLDCRCKIIMHIRVYCCFS